MTDQIAQRDDVAHDTVVTGLGTEDSPNHAQQMHAGPAVSDSDGGDKVILTPEAAHGTTLVNPDGASDDHGASIGFPLIMTVEPVNDAPALKVAAAATDTEYPAPVALSPDLSLTDGDSATLVGATAKVNDGFIPGMPGEDTVENDRAAPASVTIDHANNNPTSSGQNPDSPERTAGRRRRARQQPRQGHHHRQHDRHQRRAGGRQ